MQASHALEIELERYILIIPPSPLMDGDDNRWWKVYCSTPEIRYICKVEKMEEKNQTGDDLILIKVVASVKMTESSNIPLSLTTKEDNKYKRGWIERKYCQPTLSPEIYDDLYLTYNTPSQPQQKETVNHPPHYGGESNPYEAIKIIEALNLDFCLGNVVKYISRAGKKESASVSQIEKEIDDLQKAEWYLKRRIQQLKKFV